jgi:putative nucleotidyltransferase with HDIG domain
LNRMTAYVVVLASAAIATAIALIATGQTLKAPLTVAALAGAGALAERGGVRLTGHWEYSSHILPTLLAAVLFGPLEAAVVAAASMLGDPELTSRWNTERAPLLKWATYTSTRFIGGAAMGIAAQAGLALVGSEFGGLIAATLGAALVGESLDLAFAGVTGYVRGRPIGDALRTLAPAVVLSTALYAPLIAILAFAYVKVSPWTLALFLGPALAAQRLYGLYQEERRLAGDLVTANETLEQANLQFASALIATLDGRDRYTAGHSAAVAIYSRDIAARMDLGEELEKQAYLCGLVHDIGKIGLPAGLLEKPGALTLDERRQMQSHSVIGETILRNVGRYAEIARIVRHHHERIDGEGYPDGLAGDDIPLVSKIIAVADAYNAMTSNRPYRDAMPSRIARHRLGQAVGSQFDTSVVASFEAILASATEDYRLARRADFNAFARSTYDAKPDSDDSVSAVA